MDERITSTESTGQGAGRRQAAGGEVQQTGSTASAYGHRGWDYLAELFPDQDQQDPMQTVAEHGPAEHVEINHADGHSVHSTHSDGHKHHSKHSSAEEAHAAAGTLAGVGQQEPEQMQGNPAQAMM